MSFPQRSIPSIRLITVAAWLLLAAGAAVRDTVPAFPRAFGAPGVYFAETHAEDGAIHVVRYERGPGTPQTGP